MKNVVLMFQFFLITCSLFGQAPWCNNNQPDAYTWYINDQFGNDATSTVIIPIGANYVDVTYCRDDAAIAELKSSGICSGKAHPVWDGCDGTTNNLSSSASCITVRWTRRVDCQSYIGWVGLDLFYTCRKATINVTVISECNVPDPYCLLSACQCGTGSCGGSGNCVRITNSGNQTCCAMLTILTSPGNVATTWNSISIPAGQFVDKCVTSGTIVGYSWHQIECPPSYQRSQNSASNFNSNTNPNINKNNYFGIFPSPADDNVNIEFPTEFEGETNVEVYDISGKLILQKIFDSDLSAKISTQNWLGGMYFVKSINKQGQLSQKILIQH